jgi:hypothetical protein
MPILKRTQMCFPEELLNEIKRKAKKRKNDCLRNRKGSVSGFHQEEPRKRLGERFLMEYDRFE